MNGIEWVLSGIKSEWELNADVFESVFQRNPVLSAAMVAIVNTQIDILLPKSVYFGVDLYSL